MPATAAAVAALHGLPSDRATELLQAFTTTGKADWIPYARNTLPLLSATQHYAYNYVKWLYDTEAVLL